MTIKENPELRHVLRHILYAIEELAKGHPAAAIYEIRQVEGLVGWSENDDDFRRWCRSWAKGGDRRMRKKKKGKKNCR